MNKMLYLLPLLMLFACSEPKQEETTYEVGQIITPLGEMLFWMHDETPNHKASFISLAKANYWDSLSFNRVIEGFVIQGGCPDTPEGFDESDYLLEPEFKAHLKHVYGAVGAGRDDNPDKLSAGCQFYIVHAEEGLARLDGNYMIFGQVFKGLDVLNKIATVATDSLDEPLERVSLDVNIIEMTAQELQAKGYAGDQL